MYNKGMNFKRNLLSIITLVCSVFAISGCKDPNVFTKFEFIEEVEDKHEDIISSDGSYVKPGNFTRYTAVDKDNHDVKLGYTYDVFTNYMPKSKIRSTGDKKILVVPVEFSDFRVSELGITEDEYITNLEMAFFGSYWNNKYVSVAEYYNRASYGKLRLSGTVCDKIFTFPKTKAEINGEKDGTKAEREDVYKTYKDVIDWCKNTYHISLDEYRVDPTNPNSDVAIYMVYTYPNEEPYNEKNPTFWWDYTFEEKPLSWTSYTSLNTLTGRPDAHTLIHETGHLFGLNDYYPAETADAKNYVPEPAGRIDMMDSNVGDHTGFSKMLLDWARPYYITEYCISTEINIRSLSKYGDLILINNEWNGNCFDEYYLIEFYTPTVLNHYDATVGNSSAKLPSIPGIKIYHVDARLAYYKNPVTKPSFDYYCDLFDVDRPYSDKQSPDKNKKNLNFAHDNSTYQNVKEDEEWKKYYLYELQLNHVGHAAAGCATNYHLFHIGDTFEIGGEASWNKLNSTKYKITVTGMTYESAKVKIERN